MSKTEPPQTDAISEALDILENWSLGNDDGDRATRRTVNKARRQLEQIEARP